MLWHFSYLNLNHDSGMGRGGRGALEQNSGAVPHGLSASLHVHGLNCSGVLVALGALPLGDGVLFRQWANCSQG